MENNIIDLTKHKNEDEELGINEGIYKIRIRELQEQNKRLIAEKEKLELKLQMNKKYFPELLNSKLLGEYLGIPRQRAQELLRSTDFPMIEISGNRAIKSKLIDWICEREGTDPVDKKY